MPAKFGCTTRARWPPPNSGSSEDASGSTMAPTSRLKETTPSVGTSAGSAASSAPNRNAQPAPAPDVPEPLRELPPEASADSRVTPGTNLTGKKGSERRQPPNKKQGEMEST